MKKYNVGIIGYSWAAGAHIEAINKTEWAQVTAIYSSRKLNPSELSAKYGSDIKCYTDLREMLVDKSIHVVSVTSYPHEHAKQAILAAGAGKHLIIEKPVALSWEECLKVDEAVKKAGVKTCVCFECRYSSQFITTKAMIDSGMLGEIHYGEIDYYHGIGPWYIQFRWNVKKDSAGSSLLSAGCHALDALLFCMGNDVQEVTSMTTFSKNADFKKYEYPTSSVTLLRYSDGRIGKVASVIDCLQPYYFHVHLVGSEGSLLDNKFYSTKMGGLNRGKWSELSMKMLDSGDVSDHPYQTQFEAFFSALDKGKDMPYTSLSDSLHAHEIIFRADKDAIRSKK